MHALGIPTTPGARRRGDRRAPVVRETVLPGAVLTRVAASHIRVGTFEYAARRNDPGLAAAAGRPRHRPPPSRRRASAENPYLALLDRVVEAQAALIARWMLVGFIHGVMNTDNMAISGETIDYGPCAFMDAYDPATVFSSIDHGGRYAYGNQPAIAPVEPRPARRDAAAADRRRHRRGDRGGHRGRCSPSRTASARHWLAGMRAKLGLPRRAPAGRRARRRAARAHARAARRLHGRLPGALGARTRRGGRRRGRCFAAPAEFDAWTERWLARLEPQDGVPPRRPPAWTASIRSTSRATTSSRRRWRPRPPAISRRCEALLAWSPSPTTNGPGCERYTEPAPFGPGEYQTFCGT